MSSTHKVEVVPVVLEPIPGAERVALARVFGYTCVTGKDQWQEGDVGAYIPPDSLVDTKRPEFAFLASQARADGYVRIKAKKIRGVLSFGLLVPICPAVVGEDVTARLGVLHYDPPAKGEPGEQRGPSVDAGPAPSVYAPKYHLESGRRWGLQVFTPGESVFITEKIHGCNAKYVYSDGILYAGSMKEWKKENSENLWWKTVYQYPQLISFLQANPGLVVYGEIYGRVQDLRYGTSPGETRLAIFDMVTGTNWYSPGDRQAVCLRNDLPHVPYIFSGPFDFDHVCVLAEGESRIANHVREGVVVEPVTPRNHDYIGRVKLKWVGAGYLERSK